MLDSKYFTTIYSEDFNNYKYTIVQPKGNPMILFSKVDGTPIASLHMKPTNTDHKAIITKRTDKSPDVDFQGIMTKGDEEFSFVISNLTNHHIYFNILKEDQTAVNRVNDLGPYVSYEVVADMKDDGALILSYIKKSPTDTETKTEYVTVKKAEEKNEYKGTYYYISVVPENKPEQCDLFKETVWACVDMFSMRKPIEIPKPIFHPASIAPNPDWFSSLEDGAETNGIRNRHLIHLNQPIGINSIGSSLKHPSYDLRGSPPNPTLVTSPWLQSSIEPDLNFDTLRALPHTVNELRAINNPGLSYNNVSLTSSAMYSAPNNDDVHISNERLNQLINNEKRDISGPQGLQGPQGHPGPQGCQGPQGPMGPSGNDLEDTEEDEEEGEISGGEECLESYKDLINDPNEIVSINTPNITDNIVRYKKSAISKSKSIELPKKESAELPKDIVGGSFIGKVTTGKKMVVNWTNSTVDFNYAITSVKCKIGLSIEEKLQFNAVLNSVQLLEQAKAMFNDITKNESKSLMDSIMKIYESEMCIICLENKESQKLDTIFYQCGHQCCHYACGNTLTRCPLCQKYITSMLRV
ncbi:MAG: hypothetical protein Edafosvirus3_93 [Edafosvirus sp.]|uniref:RING-type domain-containing protein n=1 Tax=Edafosvirus sp. TaxID=2487765 RepID=A0A3G4ZT06_9VIRU|nr:MAG: hypothetical protein Edafosvirus3_93 [Edafosvirus sp.]